jgi:hypothetical protein
MVKVSPGGVVLESRFYIYLNVDLFKNFLPRCRFSSFLYLTIFDDIHI